MNSTLRWLSLVFGVLSIALLVKHGYSEGFVAPFALLLEYFERATEALLSPLAPYVLDAFAYIKPYIFASIQLAPMWKHMFVLMLLFMGAVARTYWTEFGFLVATTVFLIGLPIAITASVIWGAMGSPLTAEEFAQISLLMKVGLFVFPFLTLLIFELAISVILSFAFVPLEGRPAVSLLRYELVMFFVRLILIFVITALIFTPSAILTILILNRDLADQEFSTIIVISMLTAYAMYWRLLQPLTRRVTADDHGWATYRAKGATQVGKAILGAFVGATAFLLMNAGLQLLRL